VAAGAELGWVGKDRGPARKKPSTFNKLDF